MQALRFLNGFLSPSSFPLKVGKPNPKHLLWPNPARRATPKNEKYSKMDVKK